MDITVSWWAVAVVLGLAAVGFLAVCWVVSGWAEQAADWLRRDRVTPLLEDDAEIVRPGLARDEDGDWYCTECGHYPVLNRCDCGCCTTLLGLPPERTWEQMTSHQLPIEAGAADHFLRPPGYLPTTGPDGLTFRERQKRFEDRHAEARERRMPGWEAESRQAYAALDLEYPSGMLARVRELAP